MAIPPTGEAEGSTVSPAGESGGAVASSDDASEMTIRGGDGGLLHTQEKMVDSPLEIVGQLALDQPAQVWA